MRTIAATLVTLLVTFFAAFLIDGGDHGAQADPYRWCAQYGGKGPTNCYFLNLEQCRSAISGNGAFCVPNNFYDGRPVTTPEYGISRSGRASR
jgi:hypothetical protein